MGDKKVLITSDSTTDLSAELRDRYNIKTLPLGIILSDKIYMDGVDINPDDIYEHHAKTGQLPKTNACNLADCSEFFRKYVNEGYEIVHFTISAEMSSTYNNFRLAAEEFDHVYVVDSRSLSTGGGILVVSAAEMALKGMAAKEIAEKSQELTSKVDATFVIDSLEYLYKGGRCSALAVLGANLLKLKPCIEVRNGSMGVGKKYRGKFSDVLREYVNEKIGDYSDIDLDRVFITHAGCDTEIVEEVVKQVKDITPFKEIFVTRAGCTISSHCGANTLGVMFIKNSQI